MLEILAIVFLVPSCFAKTQEVILEVSEEVTLINKSALEILESYIAQHE